MELVFVYGTLKPGKMNNSLLKDAECVGRGVAPGFGLVTLPRVSNLPPIPGMVPCSCAPSEYARGYVFRCDQAKMRQLDAFEGNLTLYVRTKVRVCLEDIFEGKLPGVQGEIGCWAYLLMLPLEQVVANGNW